MKTALFVKEAGLLVCRKMFLQTPYRHEIHSDVQERITEAFETDCEFREIAACYTHSGDIITFQLLFLPVSLLLLCTCMLILV